MQHWWLDAVVWLAASAAFGAAGHAERTQHSLVSQSQLTADVSTLHIAAGVHACSLQVLL
jgi:hypothetical protein